MTISIDWRCRQGISGTRDGWQTGTVLNTVLVRSQSGPGPSTVPFWSQHGPSAPGQRPCSRLIAPQGPTVPTHRSLNADTALTHRPTWWHCPLDQPIWWHDPFLHKVQGDGVTPVQISVSYGKNYTRLDWHNSLSQRIKH